MSECSLCRLYRLAVEAARPRRGVRPSFQEWHVIGYLLLAYHGPVGRPTASRVLGIGDTAVKTLQRRLREMGVVESRGVVGTGLRGEYVKLVESIGLCQTRDCIGFDVCAENLCEGVSSVLRIRDSLVSAGVTPRLILCCSGEPVAPGAPPGAIREYAGECLKCVGKKLCIAARLESVLDAAKILYAVARVTCD